MILSSRIATVVSLGTLVLAPAVFAQSTSQSNPTPSQADFDACNKQAESNVGAPSAAASPRTGPMITGPGTPATGTPGSPAPSSSNDATAGTTTPGAAGERPQNAGGAQPVRPTTESSQATSSGSDARGSQDMRITGSDVPGAREAGLSGMAAAGQGNAAYQQAYQDCMKSRNF
jgi:hypothetical protein